MDLTHCLLAPLPHPLSSVTHHFSVNLLSCSMDFLFWSEHTLKGLLEWQFLLHVEMGI